ncbi:uncharacterized protein A4U43_C03F18450 [Asparagus officinalis]|uniref:Uncharacterized protein n=1 Tax=Asparagus officinalis TaxID=4686 RepID=A0A5P1FB62_ASPOF|nr:uncharacterized protein A4U43_C03F18450 [Asparagus officinalis]
MPPLLGDRRRPLFFEMADGIAPSRCPRNFLPSPPPCWPSPSLLASNAPSVSRSLTPPLLGDCRRPLSLEIADGIAPSRSPKSSGLFTPPLSLSKDAALRATQEAADDPHVLSKEENDSIAMNAGLAGGNSSGMQRRDIDDDDDS